MRTYKISWRRLLQNVIGIAGTGGEIHTYMTISFSYAYLNGLLRLIVSSDCVVTAVHRPSRATSPLMTVSGELPRRAHYGRP